MTQVKQLTNLYSQVPGLDPTAERRAQAASNIQLRQQASQLGQQAAARGLSGVRQAQALAPAVTQQQTQVAAQQLGQQQQQLGTQAQFGVQQADLDSKARMTRAGLEQQETLANQTREQYERLAEAQQAAKRRITSEDIRVEKELRQRGLIYDQSLFFLSDQQQKDLTKLDANLTKELFDARMVFAGTEQQREFTNQLQLLDWAATQARSKQELEQYMQIMQQEAKRRDIMFSAIIQEMEDIQRRGYIKEKGDLDFQLNRQLTSQLAAIKRQQAEAQAQDQRRAAIIGTVIQVAGTVALGIAMCLPGDTEIETPNGDVAIKALKPGMLVMTRDDKGRKIKARIIKVSKVPTPATHQLVVITLNDGRSVAGSPKHPDAQGRLLETLKPGDILDNSEIIKVSRLHYGNSYTYDILVDSPSSTYWADGIELRSTLTHD